MARLASTEYCTFTLMPCCLVSLRAAGRGGAWKGGGKLLHMVRQQANFAYCYWI